MGCRGRENWCRKCLVSCWSIEKDWWIRSHQQRLQNLQFCVGLIKGELYIYVPILRGFDSAGDL
jgi:hypothetical protein